MCLNMISFCVKNILEEKYENYYTFEQMEEILILNVFFCKKLIEKGDI